MFNKFLFIAVIPLTTCNVLPAALPFPAGYLAEIVPTLSYSGNNSLLIKNWWTTCLATELPTGGVNLIPGGIGDAFGSFILSQALEPSQLDFQINIHMTGIPTIRGDGYAVYIVRNTSIVTGGGCKPLPFFGLIDPPGQGLGVRVYVYGHTCRSITLPAMVDNTLQWSWPASPAPPQYNLGTFESFTETAFLLNAMLSIRLVEGNLTVEISTVLSNGTAITIRCTDNVPAPLVITAIQRGDAVIAVTGGVGGWQLNSKPTLNSLELYKLGKIPTTTTPSSTQKETTTSFADETTSSTFQTSPDPLIEHATTTLQQIVNSSSPPVKELITESKWQTTQETTNVDGSTTFHQSQSSTWPQLQNVTTEQVWQATFDSLNNLPVGDVKASLQILYPDLSGNEETSPQWLIDNISKECSEIWYERTAPPNNERPNPLQIAFGIDRVVVLDNVNESLTVSAFLFLHWNVTTCRILSADRMPWNVNQRIFIPDPQEIWLPEFLFPSSSNDIFMQTETFGDDLLGTIRKPFDTWPNKTLDFYFVRRGFYATVCDLDLRRFPFDQQECIFEFSLLRSVDSVFFSASLFLCPSDDVSTTEWTYAACSVESSENMKYEGSVVDVVKFKMTLARKPLYYVVNIILPNFMLTALAISSFFLPPYQPDRTVIVVTILLALIVSQSQITKIVPKTNYQILLCDYFLLLLAIVVVLTIYHSALCLWATRKKLCKQKASRKCDILAFILIFTLFLAIHGYVFKIAS